MSVTVGDTEMTLRRFPAHRADYDSTAAGWRVTWLPDRVLSLAEAMTAMQFTDQLLAHRADESLFGDSDPIWPVLDKWAAELHMESAECQRLITSGQAL